MITLVEKEQEKRRLMELCEKTVFGCKIASTALCYGFDKSFACFWLDTQHEVAFGLADGLMLISGTVVDPEETRAFLQAVGPKNIMCAVRNAEALSLSQIECGDVLRKQLEAGGSVPQQEEVDIRGIYRLLEEAGMADEFEPFYLDLSHKLRHKGAAAVTRYEGEELTGCALVSSFSASGAVLSGVVVAERCRRQGIGTELVKEIESFFPGMTMYLLRQKDKHREFYRQLGYTKTDTWVFGRL